MLVRQCHSGTPVPPAFTGSQSETSACLCAGDHPAAGQDEAAQEQAEQNQDSRGAGEAWLAHAALSLLDEGWHVACQGCRALLVALLCCIITDRRSEVKRLVHCSPECCMQLHLPALSALNGPCPAC